MIFNFNIFLLDELDNRIFKMDKISYHQVFIMTNNFFYSLPGKKYKILL